MSSPCELITVWCPCGSVYNDSWRASMNLSLDHFDDAYIDRLSSTTCPDCGLKTAMGTLLSRFDDGKCILTFSDAPAPLPVILYHRPYVYPEIDQKETLDWVKDWTKAKGREGVEDLLKLIKGLWEPHGDNRYPYALLSIVNDWFFETGCQDIDLLDLRSSTIAARPLPITQPKKARPSQRFVGLRLRFNPKTKPKTN
jgi:hypothetical protein